MPPPTIAPETNDKDASGSDPNTNTILTLSESSVTTGATGNTVFAKYSTSKKYTALQLMAEPNLQLGDHGAGTIGIFSTETKPARRTTALQVQHNVSYGDNTYDVASDVTEAYYWYTSDRKKAVIKAVPEKIETTAEDIKGKTLPINVKFYDAEDKDLTNPLDISTLKDYQTGLPVSYRYICNNPEIASVDKDGNVKFTGKAGRAYITIFTNKVNMFGKDEKGNFDNSTNIGYDATVTTVSLTVTDPRQLMPPIINPDGKKYFKDLKVKVTANTSDMDQSGDAYYVVVDKDAEKPSAEEIVNKNQRVAIDNFGEIPLSKRNATVYAVSYNPELNNKYSAISTETFEYVDIQDPVLTPGNKGGIYWYIGKEEDNYQLNVVASTATPNASVYYTINQPGDITDISNATLYLGGKSITVNSGDSVRAVTYLDGVYSNTVTYTYNKQEGGSWRSYSSTGNRVFRDGIQAYIITGTKYEKGKIVFIAKSINVGATGDCYLPEKTGVLLYSETLTQAQLLNDGIDGKGISTHGSGGRTQTPDLTSNMLIAADANYQPHISTYDKDGNINMAFNRWKDCAKYDGTDDYYGFFSFYEDNTRQNKNNWRHTAYLQLPRGSEENIYFRNKEKEGETISAKITIVDDEPTAIQTVQQDADKADNAYYTLSGVQVAQPTAPGIYIHNGHKIVIKK